VDAQLADKRMVLMALATIRAETASFQPISEFQSRFNTSPGGHPFDLYDNRKDLGNQGPPDGEQYRGRGFIQLTGRFNYQKHGAAIGLGNGLVDQPELANQPDIASKLLASFLKANEIAIKEALLAANLGAARKLVNGGAHGLAEFTEAYQTGDSLLPESLA
jgi:predicted chitinase